MEGEERMNSGPGKGALYVRRIDKLSKGILRSAIIIAALGFSGCSALLPEPEAPPRAEPVEQDSKIVIVPPSPAPTPKAAARISPPPPLPSLAIVLTSGLSAYADVATELMQRFENHDVYDLSDDGNVPVNTLRLVNDSDSGVVVAIGLRAAVSSVAMSDIPVVFSQVFNYQKLLTENSRGVSSIAPLDAQIAAWKEMNPTVSRIGAIVGEGHDDLIAEAELAAERHGVELLAHVAHSDQETLYIFKRMIRDIDGFWLFPDNRVLSRRALQQIMDGAERQRVPVLVPSESLLSMGASISVSSVAADIAETITKVIRQIESGNIADVPPITPLSEIRVTTSETIRVVDR